MNKGKKYIESAKLIDKATIYEPAEALDPLVCKTARAKFDETIEIHVRLGVDSRHADQQVRGAVALRTEPVKMCVCLSSAREIT